MSTVSNPILTAEQVRRIRDNFQLLSNRPDGNVDLAALLNDFSAAVETDLQALEEFVNTADPEEQVFIAEGTIAFAAVRTLNATPVTVIAAPAAGEYIEVIDCHWWLDFGTAAYDAAAAGDTLGLKYTNGSGAQLLDTVAGNAIGSASADYHAQVQAAVEVNLTAAAAAAVVAHIDAGEWYSAAGDSPLKYRIRYRVRTLAFG